MLRWIAFQRGAIAIDSVGIGWGKEMENAADGLPLIVNVNCCFVSRG